MSPPGGSGAAGVWRATAQQGVGKLQQVDLITTGFCLFLMLIIILQTLNTCYVFELPTK